jgi:hypothetical protein
MAAGVPRLQARIFVEDIGAANRGKFSSKYCKTPAAPEESLGGEGRDGIEYIG